MRYYIAKNHEVTDLTTGKVIAKPNATHYGAFTQMVNDATSKDKQNHAYTAHAKAFLLFRKRMNHKQIQQCWNGKIEASLTNQSQND